MTDEKDKSLSNNTYLENVYVLIINNVFFFVSYHNQSWQFCRNLIKRG